MFCNMLVCGFLRFKVVTCKCNYVSDVLTLELFIIDFYLCLLSTNWIIKKKSRRWGAQNKH